jgi:hypothetical protein
MFALLSRSYGEKQTTGCLSIYDEDTMVAQVKTLELPYLENHKDISCIPPGEYKCDRVTSKKFGICYILNDVPSRSNIIIHVGNYASERMLLERAIMRNVKKVDTLGCILVGLRFFDLNGDNNIDVMDSKKCMEVLRIILPSKFVLIIR